MSHNIKVQQLDEGGEVWREFQHYATDDRDVERKVDSAALAFNLEHTRVLVDGKIVLGVGRDDATA